MKNNLILIIILSFKLNINAQETSYSYSNPNIQWLGRWNEEIGLGKWTAWTGSQIVFNVHGTSKIIVNASVIDPDGSNQCALVVKFNNRSEYLIYPITSREETFSGNSSVTILLPDTNFRSVILHTSGLNSAIFNAKQKTIIKSFEIDSTGEILPWIQGEKLLQTIGDSWMATENDYPRFLNRLKWKLYPVATGGLNVFVMDKQYEFAFIKSFATDPAMDATIISFGVNDFFAKLSNAEFERSLVSLIDKVKERQLDKPIYLIQIPKNINTNNDYGKYGESMNYISSFYQNVFYISTRPIEIDMEWLPDNKHLNYLSKIKLATYIDSCILHYEQYGKPMVDINPDEIKIYPNPNSGSFVIKYGSLLDRNFEVEIFNNFGVQLNAKVIQKDGNATYIEIFNYMSGIYFVKINNHSINHLFKIIKF